jgi:hypothetical protein
MGGSDDPSNLVEVTLEQHAELHKQLWNDLGDMRDYVAWKALSGQMSNEEAIHIAHHLPKTDSHKTNLSVATKQLYEATKHTRKWGRPKGSKNKAPFSEEVLIARSGKNHPMYGKTGENNPNFGRRKPGSRPDLVMSNRLNPPAKGKPKSEEWKQKNRKPKRKRLIDAD